MSILEAVLRPINWVKSNYAKSMEAQRTVDLYKPNPLDRIVDWNISRNLNTFDINTELRLLEEELREFREAANIHDQLDALADLIVVATGSIHKLQYNPTCVVNQAVDEISSRQGTINPETGKWEKDRNQDPSTLYKADFTYCQKGLF